MDIDDRKLILDKVKNKILENTNEDLTPAHIQNVCVILTSSRGGSSVFKEVLTQSDDTIFLDGEEEPYYILTQNGYPFNSDSDKIDSFNNKYELLKLISTDIGKNISSTKEIDIDEFVNFWRNRLLLQFPQYLDRDDESFANILMTIHNIIKLGIEVENKSFDQINNSIIQMLENSQFYDGFIKSFKDAPSFNREYDSKYKIEESPFVTPKLKTRPNSQELANKTLILKTPQDCYRVDAIRELFPHANIKFIHLTRNVAATVNGLIDGWQSDKAFFAHDVSHETFLDIEDYETSNKWWKFDLPPNWQDFTQSNLEDVCVNQWIYSHKSIYESINQDDELLKIKFEDFVQDPTNILKDVTNFLNISDININELPETMTTNKPEMQRWKRKKNIINQAIDNNPRALELMRVLDYNIDDTKKWL